MALLLALWQFFIFAPAHSAAPVAALHLMTYQGWGYNVDPGPQGDRVKKILGDAVRLGFREVVFNFRGHMVTGTGAEIRSSVPLGQQASEGALLLETVRYARSLGLRVAFRPILLVIGPKGEFPYSLKGRTWWHGNIQPKDPARWFEAYFAYHKRYLEIARAAGVEWYSIGAEMNSMTSGRGNKKGEQVRGYPGEWVKLIERAREILGPATKISYGVNYTDQVTSEGGRRIEGGELEQWRYFLTEEFRRPSEQKFQREMQSLWQALDIVGIDYYRALASERRSYPDKLASLSALLTERAKSHANQLDNALTEIGLSVGYDKPVHFQEMGYRSVERSFLRPAAYENRKGVFNELHQAAAWDAFLNAFWGPGWPWFAGTALWQVLVDEDPKIAGDTGFSPLGKPLTESVLQKHFSLSPPK
ncbi:MAG: hypothetical protein EOP11_01050 [Proteobacteria bacterium]|nr:MAG: hypothetical protein EOP11_01050 [Pseudomonadota bacterium]